MPQYLFRPSQILRRVARRAWRPASQVVTVTLPWGAPIRCRSHDAIGLSIQQLGVFELGVSEVLWRLTDAGELALDVGANVGQMTAILAHRVGPTGRVIAFEPNPDVRADLEHNAAGWTRRGGAIHVRSEALSDRDGEGHLVLPEFYEWNRGTAFVSDGDAGQRGVGAVPVILARLDGVLSANDRVGVLKIDVEGHEPAVLRGAGATLAERRVRDIVYESHEGYPDAVSALLEERGYRIFAVGSGLLGPRCQPARFGPVAARWESPSFLATLEPARALDRLRPRGWKVL